MAYYRVVGGRLAGEEAGFAMSNEIVGDEIQL